MLRMRFETGRRSTSAARSTTSSTAGSISGGHCVARSAVLLFRRHATGVDDIDDVSNAFDDVLSCPHGLRCRDSRLFIALVASVGWLRGKSWGRELKGILMVGFAAAAALITFWVVR